MNSEHRPALASRLTQRWVRAYTVHLDPALRDTRRAELASDLWEHEAAARRMGLGSVRINAQILRRLLAGISADLSWRRQQRDATPAFTTPPPVLTTAPSSRWACRVRGHHYVTKRLPNRLDDGGTYCVCERCNHEKVPPGGPPAHWMSGFGP
jgi:hypothetical protein